MIIKLKAIGLFILMMLATPIPSVKKRIAVHLLLTIKKARPELINSLLAPILSSYQHTTETKLEAKKILDA